MCQPPACYAFRVLSLPTPKTQPLSGKCCARRAQFGVSKVLGGTLALAATAVGTPYYLSPEIAQGRKYSYKVPPL